LFKEKLYFYTTNKNRFQKLTLVNKNMTKIEFTTNLPLSNDPLCPKPWQFDKKHFDGLDKNGNHVLDVSGKPKGAVPNKPGVYIVGVKIEVNDPPQEFDKNGNPLENAKAVEKFCPLYVGISKDLRTRIRGHRNGPSGELNHNKELFNFLNVSPFQFYKDIKFFDRNYIRSGCTKYSNLKNIVFQRISNNPYHNSLIWFPDFQFFNQYLNLTTSTYGLPNGINNGHEESIRKGGDLDTIGTQNSLRLKNDIISVKKGIEDKFWYCYSTLDSIVNEIINNNFNELLILANLYKINPVYNVGRNNGHGKAICEIVESSIKDKLNSIDIYTYAGVQTSPLNQLCFDLSPIQNDLVNMTGKPFPNNLII